MNDNLKKRLLLFYFGAIEEEDRILVERELLTDTESLVDYLDLKRSLEAAEEIPSYPSPLLWNKLQFHLSPRKKLFFSLSIGALAASLIVFSIYFYKSNELDSSRVHQNQILFDSSRELPVNSNVL